MISLRQVINQSSSAIPLLRSSQRLEAVLSRSLNGKTSLISKVNRLFLLTNLISKRLSKREDSMTRSYKMISMTTFCKLKKMTSKNLWKSEIARPSKTCARMLYAST